MIIKARAALGPALLALATWSSLGQGKDPPKKDRYEPSMLPAFGGDTDLGFKFGAFFQLARFQDDLRPYAWRAQALAEASVLEGATGTEFPYRETYLKIDWPQAAGGAFRLLTEVSYLRTTNRGYYGVGNSSTAQPGWKDLQEGSDAYVQARRLYQYDGSTPSIRTAVLFPIGASWKLVADAALRWVLIHAYEGSLLQRHIAQGPGAGQKLWGTGEYVQPLLAAGFAYDTRDHESATTTGQYHDVSVRCAPRFPDAEPYCGANLTLRGYVPIAAEKLSLAGRLVGDVVTDRAPLLELSRYGGIAGGPSVAGSRGIRGVPQGRLQGRTKVIANLELRSFFVSFQAGDTRLALGAAAFVDAGRVWTGAFESVQPLDGRGLHPHWGAGGGPRMRWGDALVIRADIAYAPLGAAIDASPAFYFEVEQVM